jgi:hypothetical protein
MEVEAKFQFFRRKVAALGETLNAKGLDAKLLFAQVGITPEELKFASHIGTDSLKESAYSGAANVYRGRVQSSGIDSILESGGENDDICYADSSAYVNQIESDSDTDDESPPDARPDRNVSFESEGEQASEEEQASIDNVVGSAVSRLQGPDKERLEI